MKPQAFFVAALFVAVAGPAAADMPTSESQLYNYIHVTVQNCMYDGHTHEFVIYPHTASQGNNDQQKLDIAHGSSAVMTCKDDKPGNTCQVKVHGSHNQYDATSAITFYANRKVNNFVDVDCSREHGAGAGQTSTDDEGDDMP
jgi:hypothetical protein